MATCYEITFKSEPCPPFVCDFNFGTSDKQILKSPTVLSLLKIFSGVSLSVNIKAISRTKILVVASQKLKVKISDSDLEIKFARQISVRFARLWNQCKYEWILGPNAHFVPARLILTGTSEDSVCVCIRCRHCKMYGGVGSQIRPAAVKILLRTSSI